MLNRATVVDANFQACVKQGRYPKPVSLTTLSEVGLDRATLLALFESQLLARHLDLQARLLKEKNQSYYTIGSSGHEGNAALGYVFRHTDLAFLHYRSAAFMLQRLQKITGCDPVYDLMLSFVASAADPCAGGRHKVFGSYPGFVPPQTSTIASHLAKAVGAAFSIVLAKENKMSGYVPSDSVVLCSFGDASVNHSVAQGAFNAAQWIAYGNIPLPIIFICEDNGIGISVPTPPRWIEDTMAGRIGMHYLTVDGLNLADVYRASLQAQYLARVKRQPVFIHFKCVRLLGHAGSDIEQHYLSQAEIEAHEFNDPLLHSARMIREYDYLSADAILGAYQAAAERVAQAAAQALETPKLMSGNAVMASLIPAKRHIDLPTVPNEQQRAQVFAKEYSQLSNKRNLCQLINYALTDLMLQFPNIVVFGEDVAKKGGVYRVTADLVARFGQRRVFDSLLDETTILGHAIGLAHNGFLPIPEIQFLAYFHNAEDQIRGEAASLSFFSNGQFTNPMVIRIAGLAYQKGFGGHFHNDNSIAVLRDVPGIIVACPAQGADAARMLRECVRLAYQEQRVVIFLEPIALYMTKDLHDVGDQLWLQAYPPLHETMAFGEVGEYGDGQQLAIITYGNGYYLARQAEKVLREQYQCPVKIIDLRWLVPLPKMALLKAIADYSHVLIVDEGRRSGSISEEIVTLMVENLIVMPKVMRLTAEDCYIPLGEAWQYLLPSRDSIVQAALRLLQHTPITVENTELTSRTRDVDSGTMGI